MATEADVLSWIADITRNPRGSVTAETVLEGLSGWDSLANEEFRMLVEDRLSLEIDGIKVDRSRTAGDLLKLMDGALSR